MLTFSVLNKVGSFVLWKMVIFWINLYYLIKQEQFMSVWQKFDWILFKKLLRRHVIHFVKMKILPWKVIFDQNLPNNMPPPVHRDRILNNATSSYNLTKFQPHLKYCTLNLNSKTSIEYVCYTYEVCCLQGCCAGYSMRNVQSWQFWWVLEPFYVIGLRWNRYLLTQRSLQESHSVLRCSRLFSIAVLHGCRKEEESSSTADATPT